MRIVLALLAVAGCTENEAVRQFGGAMTVDIPCGEKVFDVTWKENDFWYASRPIHQGEEPETLHFRSKSSYGVYEGSVTLVESRCKK